MPHTVTLTTLRQKARLYADQRDPDDDDFITDTELDLLINSEYRFLYDELVSVYGHEYFATTDTISVVAEDSQYDLPDDFYQLLGVQALWGSGQNETIEQFDAARYSEDLQTDTWTAGSPKFYRLFASTIEFIPPPTTAVTVRLKYVPVPEALAEGGGEGV